MDFSKERLSIEEAKEMDMVHYLSSLGYEPSKVRHNDYWYYSPLRDEKTPSFKINRKINRWYDHGIGKGGNLIDFAILYHGCTIGELLQNLSGCLPIRQQSYPQASLSHVHESHLKILSDSTLFSIPLIRYLRQRRIPVQTADRYCREVRYELNGKLYYAIGFKNNSGGFELRNPYFKGSSSPKDITTIDNHADEIIVFEGFMDFLSFKVTRPKESGNSFDFAVLNSVSFFEKARPFMESHQAVRLYLDRDTTGQKYSRYALSLNGKYKDESSLYQNYKDFNDWLMNFGKGKRQYQKQTLR